MFETLVTTNSQVRRLDPRILPVTLMVHGAVLFLMLVVNVWQVEDLPVPNAMFDQPFIQVTLPPPPPAAPPRGVERQQATPPETPRAPEIVQPEIVPPTPPEPSQTTAVSAPLDDLAPASDQGAGSTDGVDGSIGPVDGTSEGDCTVNCGDGQAQSSDEPTIIVPGIDKPQVLKRVNPFYPELARRAGKQGTVIVEAVIDTAGNVRDARVVSRSLGLGLEESALAAVKQWRFAPATRNGKPVSVYFNLTVTFSLFH